MELTIDLKKLMDSSLHDLKVFEYMFLQACYEEKFEEAKLIISKVNDRALKSMKGFLEMRQWIKQTGEGTFDFDLRDKTIKLFSPVGFSIHDFAIQYRNLWPPGLKSGGYSVRSNLPDIETKLKKFFKKYKYSPEVVLKATEKYLDRMKADGYSFVKLANYFIMKDNTSMLASECETINEVRTDKIDFTELI